MPDASLGPCPATRGGVPSAEHPVDRQGIPRFFDERSCLKLVFATLWRASQRWRGVKFSAMEKKQLEAYIRVRQSCLKVLEHGVITTIQFCEKEILDEMQISEMQAELMALIDAKTRPLVLIDFHNAHHMSSACLGLLVAVNTRVNKKERRLRLANIQPKLMTVFSLTKLDTVLKISSTRMGAEPVLLRIAEEQAMGSV